MIDTSQPGVHPDVEQLAAFAEGALPEHERLLVLSHTAECPRCREIAFLAQEPSAVATPAAAPVQAQAPWWRAWSHPWSLGAASALVAAALLLAVFLWKRPGSNNTPAPTVATNEKQEPVSPAPAPTPQVPAPSARSSTAPELANKPVPTPAGPPAAPLAEAAQRAAAAQASTEAPAAAQVVPPLPLRTVAPSPPAGVLAPGEPLPVPASPQRAVPPASLAKAEPPAVAQDKAATVAGAVQASSSSMASPTFNAAQAAKLRAVAVGPLRLQVDHGSGPANGKAELSGTVLDPSGASIPGATVSLRGPSAGASATTVTDGAGHFALPSVPAGAYQAEITAPGFASVAQPLDLQARDVAHADPVLDLGAASQTVAVNAAVAGLSTTNPPITDGVRQGAISGQKQAVPAQTPGPLPGGRNAVSTVVIGGTTVALDSTGTLFRRHSGRGWQRVVPTWPGPVKVLASAVPTAASDYGHREATVFQITTAAAAVWQSPDGEHWKKRQ